MEYSRTYDKEFIRECVTNDAVWRASSDDSPLDKELYFPQLGAGFVWVKAGDYGVFLGHKVNHIEYEVHTVLLPKARGKASKIAKGAMLWFFDNSECLRLTTKVPSYNRLAARLAEKSGMILYGTNHKSFQKDGVLYDQYLYGISKDDN